MKNKCFPWVSHYDPHVKPNLDYPQTNLVALLEKITFKAPGNIFIRHRSETVTFREAYGLICNLASNLMNLGLEKGDRVALILPNCPQFVVSYYAILKAGGIVVALNPNFTHQEYLFLISDSDPKIVICQKKHLKILRKGILSENIVLVISDFPNEEITSTTNPGFFVYEGNKEIRIIDLTHHLLLSVDNHFPIISHSDPAIFQYSGGTTGMPKAAIGLHQNIIANVTQFINWCDLQKYSEVVLAAIPLYHVYGMVLALNMAAALGSTVVLVDNPRDINYILDEIENRGVSFFPGVPAIYHSINQNERGRNDRSNLGSIKACISGSYPLHVQIKRDFEQLSGGKLIEGYGLSEAPTATHCNPLYGKNKEGSIGLPLPDVFCRIVDLEEGKTDVPVGQPGELIIQGPQVMAGYFRQPEEENQVLRNGWLFTGDVATMDEEGYFFIIDRKKSLIKVNGLQVWPNEVEAALNSHPLVIESAVGGVPDLDSGERVIAWIVNKGEQQIDTDELITWCRARLAAYKVPSEFISTDSLPKTGVGKILRRELIAGYLRN